MLGLDLITGVKYMLVDAKELARASADIGVAQNNTSLTWKRLRFSCVLEMKYNDQYCVIDPSQGWQMYNT